MKSFILGVVTGVVLTFVALFVIEFVNQNSGGIDPIKYLEQPESYENKKETSFKVLQIIGNSALATEASDKIGRNDMYYGNTVLILVKCPLFTASKKFNPYLLTESAFITYSPLDNIA